MDRALLLQGERRERKWSEKYYGEKCPEIKVPCQARSARVTLGLHVMAARGEWHVVSPSDDPLPAHTFAPTVFLCHGSLCRIISF